MNLNAVEEVENQTTLRKYLDRQGRLSQLISLEAFNWLADSQKRQADNEEAENKWARKHLWGQSEGSNVSDDEMRQTILGDITNPTPVVISQPQQNQLLPMLALAAATGLGGYWLAAKNTNPTNDTGRPTYSDETVDVGLGKIEDYQK